MKSKTIAIIGIASYILSILASATDVEGNAVSPAFLIIISGLLTITFIIVATIRLWKMARYNVSITLAASSIILCILEITQLITLPKDGSAFILLLNITKIVRLFTYFYAIIILWRMAKFDKSPAIISKESVTNGKINDPQMANAQSFSKEFKLDNNTTQKAMEYYLKSISFYNRGIACDGLGRYQEAIEAYRQAIRIKPDYAEAYCGLGLAHYKLSRYQDAIESYKQAIRIKPNYVEAHCNLGLAYDKLGRYQNAIEAYGCYQDEIEAYKQAIKIKPDYAKAYYNLGIAYLALPIYWLATKVQH
jgi:tetratricopeptide (TPR) repeat protein